MELTITTFNLENLFNRYVFVDDPMARYESGILRADITNIDRTGQPTDVATTVLQRNHTARAILDCRPDVLAVQEVEDLSALRLFNEEFLDGYFDRLVLIEGNDMRGIDVALCLRRGCPAVLGSIRTHVDEPVDPKREISRYYDIEKRAQMSTNVLFSRDCLEVDVDARGAPLTFLVNHLKSQTDGSDKVRLRQAERVAAIAREVKEQRKRLPIVLGDLNCKPTDPSLAPIFALVSDGRLSDPFGGDDNAWTHYYAIAKEKSRLDYILIDGSLAGAVTRKSILRSGLTLKCDGDIQRYPAIGYERTEASDHCPVTITLQLGGR